MSGYNLFQPEISKNYGKVEWREDLKVSSIVPTPCNVPALNERMDHLLVTKYRMELG